MTDMSPKKKVAVVLFNLGGPDSLKAVKPFLFNLFYDPAIIALKNPLRWLAAKYLSGKRAAVAREIYGKIGGKSPLLELSQDQATALEQTLNEGPETQFKCFVTMRYWHPFSKDVVKKVRDYNPDQIILLPLYPHYSITTVGSSLIDWDRQAKQAGLTMPFRVIRDYPVAEGFIEAHVSLLEDVLKKIDRPEDYRILYSAHGLPEKIIAAGDPYRQQIERSCRAIQEKLSHADHVVCFQSRVGPLKWIEPFTDDEIKRAGSEGKSLIIVPISFVSEHSETLVELDMDYKDLADDAGVKDYIRVAAIGCHDRYISALADLTRGALI